MTRGAVDVSSNLLPPGPTDYNTANIANQQRDAASASFAQQLLQMQAQATTLQAQGAVPHAIPGAQQAQAPQATTLQPQGAVAQVIAGAQPQAPHAFMTLPELQNYVRSLGTQVLYERRRQDQTPPNF